LDFFPLDIIKDKRMFEESVTVIKGAGYLASGVALRLWRCGFHILMTELEHPTSIRRTVSFSEAVYTGRMIVEEANATLINDIACISETWEKNSIPIIVDSRSKVIDQVKPQIVIDARIAKRNLDTRLDEAPLVIGLGPGFFAKKDVHAVIETNRGHYLGRVMWEGQAEPDTGVPGEINGIRSDRVIYAPATGIFLSTRKIGDIVDKGELLGTVSGVSVNAGIAGVLRGLIHDGVTVQEHLKIGDVDPRANPNHCLTVSEKAMAISGGVLEAILVWMKTK
jgi:xanthine dehydrogenase accessory factor